MQAKMDKIEKIQEKIKRAIEYKMNVEDHENIDTLRGHMILRACIQEASTVF